MKMPSNAVNAALSLYTADDIPKELSGSNRYEMEEREKEKQATK